VGEARRAEKTGATGGNINHDLETILPSNKEIIEGSQRTTGRVAAGNQGEGGK